MQHSPRNFPRKLTHLVAAFSLLSATCAPLLAPPARSETTLTRATYEECASRDEDQLKAALTGIATDALKAGTANLDYAALVGDAWRKHGLDDVIDKRVDIAVDEVRHETSWSERLKSLANTEAAQKLATNVAERVYRSDAVSMAFEQLAADVARHVGKGVEMASSDAAAPVVACLKAFVGPRYGSAVADAVAGDASKDMAIDPTAGEGAASAGAILSQSGGGIAGATLVIVRRQLANLATRIGQRVVGSVLTRVVSIAAGGIGLVLIAKDIWELRNGVLPIIATEMKARATKDKVQEEIAATIRTQITDHVQEIGAAAGAHVVEIWQTFKRAHAMVLRIAEGNGDFRGFLDSVAPANMARLTEVVSLLASNEGEAAITTRLANGTLNTAVNVMPERAMVIARDTGSVADALAWTAIAGERLDAVLEYDIHKRAKAADFSATSLNRLLALSDRAAITRLAAVGRDARDILYGLEGNDLIALARSLSEPELSSLAQYLAALKDEPRQLVLKAVASSPSIMQVLSAPRVRSGILASPDQTAAVTMMLEQGTAVSPKAMAHDAVMAWEGRVSPWLLPEKHPIGLAGLGFLAFILLVWFARLFRRRPPPPPAANASA
ncbi:MAG: hypothetical protein ACRCS9_11805 [Hyphomicrobium sp.]